MPLDARIFNWHQFVAFHFSQLPVDTKRIVKSKAKRKIHKVTWPRDSKHPNNSIKIKRAKFTQQYSHIAPRGEFVPFSERI
ncbi:MAG: hypothetical protein LBI79_10205 [Nitrososphaerota archaeon]|nr:hypothetical protein [Nitrososphaerota archaeon]